MDCRGFSNRLLGFVCTCPVCGNGFDRSAQPSAGICRTCIDALVPVEDPVCKICGYPLSSEVDTCFSCRNASDHNPFSAPHTGLFLYDTHASRLMKSFKSRGYYRCALFFAQCIGAYLETVPEPFLICPVPSLFKSRFHRGFDHMACICSFLEPSFRQKCRRILVRNGGSQQKELGREERKTNMSHAIFTKKMLPEPKAGMVLLDDVRTTGATLDACTAVLAAQGYDSIRTLSLFLD